MCPHCGCVDNHYYLQKYRRWKCRAARCAKQFSVFAGTKFHQIKLSPLQAALLLFFWQEGAEGISSREVAGLLKLSYGATHVLIMKIREALLQTQDTTLLSGIVEVDAAFFNRHVRPPNMGTAVSYRHKKTDTSADEPNVEEQGSGSAEEGESATDGPLVAAVTPPKKSKKGAKGAPEVDERKQWLRNPHMHALIAFVERRPSGGISRVRTGVVKTENQVDIDALTQQYIHPSATVHTDESGAYSLMIATASDHKRVKHKTMFVDTDGMHTNHVECFFAEMRRSQAGTYHRFGLGYLPYYVLEMGWRLEMRDKPNRVRLEDLARRVLCSGPSVQFADVWNKRPKAKVPRPKVAKPAQIGVAYAIPAGSLQATKKLPKYRRPKHVSREKPRAEDDGLGTG